jgi:hypothetical protein
MMRRLGRHEIFMVIGVVGFALTLILGRRASALGSERTYYQSRVPPAV